MHQVKLYLRASDRSSHLIYPTVRITLSLSLAGNRLLHKSPKTTDIGQHHYQSVEVSRSNSCKAKSQDAAAGEEALLATRISGL